MSNQLVLLSLADIFSIYPKIFQEILVLEELKRSRGGSIFTDFFLPSDSEWQEKVYYRLLEVQKRINDAIENGIAPEEIDKKCQKPIWDPIHDFQNISPMVSPSGVTTAKRKRCVIDLPIEFIDLKVIGCWSLENISNAGKLLRKPPIPVHFDDEHEMRKAYSLIYDVFRYKHVLSESLNDVGFYGHFSQLQSDQNRVWLLLFELYIRHFAKRLPEDARSQEILYKESDLDFIAECLWTHRIRLAASISRLRIKNGALHLSQLLPVHLQDEKVSIAAVNPIVTGWMNPFKIKDKSIAIAILNEMGMTEVIDTEIGKEAPLQNNQFKWDKICPLFMSCIPSDRSEFAQSELVKKNYFVMQDRTFSLAPAVLSRLLDHFDLNGDIVQTHVSSPRSTAYLAALFYSINRVNDFLAFGAGTSLFEYKDYMKLLGVNNINLFAENFCNLPLESTIIETTVGIFATPPNSFSGVSDPIDLICSRGGDLSMLEVLTESEISDNGKKRVAHLLEEQRNTLRLSMSRPQVQFVLYETHSIVGTENQDMVAKTVDDINQCAFDKHLNYFKEKKRLEALAELEAAAVPAAALTPRRRAAAGSASGGGGGGVSGRITSSTTVKTDAVAFAAGTIKRKGKFSSRKNSQDSQISVTDEIQSGSTDDITKQIKVPKTDEFIVIDVPDFCINHDKCLKTNSMGCYISLMQRKVVTKLDAKYLIKMAEKRGLFGSSDQKRSAKPKSSKKPERKDKNKEDLKKDRNKKNDIASLIERINQPTHASMHRSHVPTVSSAEKKILSFDYVKKSCNRHNKHHTIDFPQYANPYMTSLQLDPRAKKWWRETTNYVNQLRTLQKPKSSDKILCNINAIKNKLPPLHLSRTYNDLSSTSYADTIKTNRIQAQTDRFAYPVAINHLEFNNFGIVNKATDKIFKFTLFQDKPEIPFSNSRHSKHIPKPLGYNLFR